MAVAQGEDGVGCLDVVHRHLPVRGVVALGEGVEVGLVFPVIVVFSHRPVDGVVFEFEGSEEVHGVFCSDAAGQLVVVTPQPGIYRESHRWSWGLQWCSDHHGPARGGRW